jgi:hypothetical protein
MTACSTLLKGPKNFFCVKSVCAFEATWTAGLQLWCAQCLLAGCRGKHACQHLSSGSGLWSSRLWFPQCYGSYQGSLRSAEAWLG